MKAILCEQPGILTLTERTRPAIREGEVLVSIRRVGVCGTDLHIFQGKHPYLNYPRVMGHELSGEVLETAGHTHLAVGDQVYINPYIACRVCHACKRGKPNCCVDIGVLGVHRDGGMCEILAVPARNVFRAEGVTLDQAAMVEFLAVGCHAIRRGQISERDRVLVVGVGPIGLGAALFATLRGAEVTVLDAQQRRLDFCRSAIARTTPVLAGDTALEALAERTKGDFFDVVIDATGNTASIENSFSYVAHGGNYVLLSVVKDRISFLDSEFHKREMRLIGSRNALQEDFDEVLDAMRDGKVPTDRMLTHRSLLEAVPERFAEWIKPETGVIKAIVSV
jgi:2-desacetyl-2-hydroxyethyl bacteriochlorophyllide A dehydrogenase